MRYRSLWLLLFSAILVSGLSVMAQEKPGSATTTVAAAASGPVTPLAPDAPVLTIQGVCETPTPVTPQALFSTGPGTNSQGAAKNTTESQVSSAPSQPDCKRVVTKKEFEDLINSLNPKASVEKKRRFAADYAEILFFDQTARQFGLDKDPDLQEFLHYKQSQAMQIVLINYLQSEANQMSDAEVEQYYKDHLQRFEEIGLARIFVPLYESEAAKKNPDAEPTAADRAAMQKVAESIQQQAARGGNFEALEAKAYKTANTDEEPPEVDLGDKWTIDNLPPEHRDMVTKMKVGEVSPLIVHPLGWQIFKVTSRRTVPLNEAGPVARSLRMRDAMQTLKARVKAQMSDAYFGQQPAEKVQPTE